MRSDDFWSFQIKSVAREVFAHSAAAWSADFRPFGSWSGPHQTARAGVPKRECSRLGVIKKVFQGFFHLRSAQIPFHHGPQQLRLVDRLSRCRLELILAVA